MVQANRSSYDGLAVFRGFGAVLAGFGGFGAVLAVAAVDVGPVRYICRRSSLGRNYRTSLVARSALPRICSLHDGRRDFRNSYPGRGPCP